MKADKYKACIIARMETFQDTRARKKLITLTWSRLRLVDPTLLPWGVDETIATNNPQVLDKDHLMQKNCFSAFWTSTYAQDTGGIAKAQTFVAWCRVHERYEFQKHNIPQSMFQLVCGFFTYRDWIDIFAGKRLGRCCRHKSIHEQPDRRRAPADSLEIYEQGAESSQLAACGEGARRECGARRGPRERGGHRERGDRRGRRKRGERRELGDCSEGACRERRELVELVELGEYRDRRGRGDRRERS